MKLCYNCFHEIDDTATVCGYCNYSTEIRNETQYPNALPCGCMLLDRYRIGRVLGQGGFGITYIAEDSRTGVLVAIKEYFPDTMAMRDSSHSVVPYNRQRTENFVYGKNRFLEEAKTLSEFIDTPNIVRVKSFFDYNGTAYFVMEYLNGCSLKKYIRDRGGKISWQETVKMFTPVMDALSKVHDKGIIHRDVTPDNIVVTDNGEIKLLDFGAARYSMGEKSQSLDIILKHGFAPYEQYMRHSRQGPFTDVYSLAASIYYAITGEIPPDSVERLDEDKLELPSGLGVQIPRKAEEALMKALSVRSEDRFQSMSDFKYALRHGIGKNLFHKYNHFIRIIFLAAAATLILGIGVIVSKKLKNIPQEIHSQAAEENTAQTASVAADAGQPQELDQLLARAKQGEVEAMLSVGEKYYKGEDTEQNYEEALSWFEKAAEQGSSDAQYITGYMYQHGEGTAQNYSNAFKWYTQAALKGNSDAQYQVGYFYEYGVEVEQDYEKALKFYEMSAETGNADAQYAAGTIYEGGYLGDPDYEKAFSWYEQAAEKDLAAAQTGLGRLYKYGLGVDQDDKTACQWFQKAADQQYAGAQNYLGMAYYDGLGVEQNYEKALDLYLEAAEQGLAAAQNNAGWMFAQGLGTTTDLERAVDWFRKAAQQDYAAAQNNLGYMYMEGKGVDQDYKEAREWFEKASALGYGAASFSLGEIYYGGLGVDADREEAIKWYTKAVEQGYEDAQTKLDSIK